MDLISIASFLHFPSLQAALTRQKEEMADSDRRSLSANSDLADCPPLSGNTHAVYAVFGPAQRATSVVVFVSALSSKPRTSPILHAVELDYYNALRSLVDVSDAVCCSRFFSMASCDACRQKRDFIAALSRSDDRSLDFCGRVSFTSPVSAAAEISQPASSAPASAFCTRFRGESERGTCGTSDAASGRNGGL